MKNKHTPALTVISNTRKWRLSVLMTSSNDSGKCCSLVSWGRRGKFKWWAITFGLPQSCVCLARAELWALPLGEPRRRLGTGRVLSRNMISLILVTCAAFDLEAAVSDKSVGLSSSLNALLRNMFISTQRQARKPGLHLAAAWLEVNQNDIFVDGAVPKISDFNDVSLAKRVMACFCSPILHFIFVHCCFCFLVGGKDFWSQCLCFPLVIRFLQ